VSNIRIVYNNAADRATITASSTAGSLAASNLKTDFKSAIYRSTGTTTTITLTWTTAEFVGMVALPFSNLTSPATLQVKCYTESTDVSPVLDTGVVSACAAAPLGAWDWGNVPLGVNAYSYVGSAYGRAWFETNAIKKMEVIISDTTNPSGYIEASRIVCGAYFEPINNAELNAQWAVNETSTNTRNDSSDLITDLGSKSKKISFSLEHMTPSDRASVTNILRGNGIARPVFLSLFPEDSDASQEQLYQVYGKLSQQSAVSIAYWNAYSSTLEVEES